MAEPVVSIAAGLTPPLPNDPAWGELRSGVRIRILHDDVATGYRVAMLHYQPGASVPKHQHTDDEHVFILSGSQYDERGHYPAGSYVFNPKGMQHIVRSDEGCLVLIHWRAPVKFLEPL